MKNIFFDNSNVEHEGLITLELKDPMVLPISSSIENENQLVLNLPLSTVPKHLLKTLDVVSFNSVVENIILTREETYDKIAINTKRKFRYVIKKNDKWVYLFIEADSF